MADVARWAVGLVDVSERLMRPDPQRDAVYAAERESADNWGPQFSRIADAQRFVDAVLADPAWVDQFPDAPLDVPVIRRSTSARYSAADVETGAIHLTRAGLCGPIVLHELAHLADHSLGASQLPRDSSKLGADDLFGAGRAASIKRDRDRERERERDVMARLRLHDDAGKPVEIVEPHGARFVGIHLMLVRRFCGFHAYGDYRAALDRHGVRYEWPVSS